MVLPGRLRSKREFDRVFQEGRSVANRWFALYCAPAEGEDKVGIVISRRIGKAVTRNRLRRQVREIIRADFVAPTTGHHFIVIARRVAAGGAFREIRDGLVGLLKECGLAVEPKE